MKWRGGSVNSRLLRMQLAGLTQRLSPLLNGLAKIDWKKLGIDVVEIQSDRGLFPLHPKVSDSGCQLAIALPVQ